MLDSSLAGHDGLIGAKMTSDGSKLDICKLYPLTVHGARDAALGDSRLLNFG